MKYKYNVISYKGEDVTEIEDQLKSDLGDDTVPERSVQITDECKTSKRVSQCYLTHEEAVALKNNSKVFDVELDLEERDDVFCVHTAQANHDFNRKDTTSTNLELTNYGLIRHTSREEFLYDDLSGDVNTEFSDTYTYNNTGHGVDIFIIDTGVQGDHPDFNDAYGNSRIQKIDWTPYVEETGFFSGAAEQIRRNNFRPENYYIEDEGFHGTQCASISAGLRYGWAKNAHIYSCKAKIGDFNFNHPTTGTWLSLIKDFVETRKSQGINRQVVINCSFGFVTTGYDLEDVLGGSYADENTERASWNRGALTDDELLNNYRLTPSNYINAILTSINAKVDELIDLGCHFAISSGNSGIRNVKPDDPEYDNFLTVSQNGTTRTIYPNRVGTPYSDSALYCGALDNYLDGTTDKEIIANYSNRGKAIDIMAAANNSFCAASKLATNLAELRAHPEYPNEKIHSFGGTSCAAPQTAGVMALYLSHRPHLSADALKEIIIEDSTKDIINSTGDYTTLNSFLDTPNRLLYSKFNQDNTFTINNSASIKCVNLGTPYKLKTQYKPESTTFSGRGVLPKGLAENYGVSSSFQNVDANMLYNGFKLKHLIFDSFADKITVELGLNGDPNNINAHNWIALELYNKKNKTLVKLGRHDADFDPVKQTFYWESFDYDDATTQGIFDYSGFTNNVIGIT